MKISTVPQELEQFIKVCEEFNGGLYTDSDGVTIPVYQAKLQAMKELEDAKAKP